MNSYAYSTENKKEYPCNSNRKILKKSIPFNFHPFQCATINDDAIEMLHKKYSMHHLNMPNIPLLAYFFFMICTT